MSNAPAPVRSASSRFVASVGMIAIAALGASACSTMASSSAATSHPPTAPTTSTTTTTVAPTTTTLPLPLPRPGLGMVKPKVPKGSAYFGSWRGPGPGRPLKPQASVKDAEAAIGRKYAIDHRYYGWGDAIPSAYETWTVAQGRIPMVSLCACRFADGSIVKWARIAAGKEDAYLTSIAQGFVALNAPAFFVFDAESENNVGIRGTAADYVAAWRHVVALFRGNGAVNVAFVWSTTAYAFRPESGQAALVASLYPGDDVVDWIASDPYNFFNSGAWHSLSYELAPWYAWATANHVTKPLALTEWGSKEDPAQPTRKAAWFRGALTALQSTYQAIHAVVYFDEQKSEHGTVNDWRIDTGPASLAAFAEISQASWFRAHQ